MKYALCLDYNCHLIYKHLTYNKDMYRRGQLTFLRNNQYQVPFLDLFGIIFAYFLNRGEMK